MATPCWVVREEGPSMDVAFADYLAKADLSAYSVINPNSRTISISSKKIVMEMEFLILKKSKMEQIHLIQNLILAEQMFQMDSLIRIQVAKTINLFQITLQMAM